MSLQFRKLLCAILTLCLTACASAPAYQIDQDNPGDALEALSQRLDSGERITVRLNNGDSLDMRFSEVTDNGLVGWEVHHQGYQADDLGRVTIAWEDIDRLEMQSGNNTAAVIGKVLLVAVILAGVIAIATAGGGYEFGGFNFTGGGGG